MPSLYPQQAILRDVLAGQSAFAPRPSKPTPLAARPDLYTAWNVADDAKNKANQLGQAATKEFEKASSKAQSAAGKIELFSGKYYAACTFGGMLACVSHRREASLADT
jgi:solute carrier family 25 (mitochondrial phosphate transporter), member 3